MQLFRKRWQIRRSGRWPWGTVLLPLLLTIAAGAESDVSVHWPFPLNIPQEMRDRVKNLLGRHYAGDFRRLPFTRLCRLPHYISLYLLTDPDAPEPFYAWCDATFGPHEDNRILMVAGPSYWALFKPAKSNKHTPVPAEATAIVEEPQASAATPPLT